MPNIELMDRVAAYIEEHPEDHYQEDWRCGTAACFAGWTALLSGAQWVCPVWEAPTAPVDHIDENGFVHVHNMYRVIDPKSGLRVPVGVYAQKILGITAWEADELFDPDNDIGHIKVIIDGYRAVAAAEELPLGRGFHADVMILDEIVQFDGTEPVVSYEKLLESQLEEVV